MRKFYLRWWWTSDWWHEQSKRVMRGWDGHFAALFPAPYVDKCTHHPGMSGEEWATQLEGEGYTIRDGKGSVRSLRRGRRAYLKNPFTPDEEIVFDEWQESPRRANSLRITKIDMENKTVTLG